MRRACAVHININKNKTLHPITLNETKRKKERIGWLSVSTTSTTTTTTTTMDRLLHLHQSTIFPKPE